MTEALDIFFLIAQLKGMADRLPMRPSSTLNEIIGSLQPSS